MSDTPPDARGAVPHDSSTDVGAASIRRAADRLQGVVHRTPLVTSRTLDRLTGAQLVLKAECFQRGGSFKLRGAFNKMATLGSNATTGGVVASSSGNHAQAVAIAARLVGTKATIVMPTDALESKRLATRGYGADVVLCDRAVEDLEERAVQLAAERGVPLVHPFDDPLVVAGQGTVALELLEDTLGVDVLLVPVGGGGLVAGSAIIAKEIDPSIRVVGVEPAGADDTKRSLAAGERIRLPKPASIADGQLVPSPGVLTFGVIRRLVDEVMLVEDEDIARAMLLLFERLKIVAEPSGASALAAAIVHANAFRGARVGVVLSGGNVDAHRFAGLIAPLS